MSWNDGVTKELADFLERICEIGDKSKQAIIKQVDIEANKLRAELFKSAPRGVTLGLVNSLTKIQVTDRPSWYGWRIEFQGKDAHGTPYQKIANMTKKWPTNCSMRATLSQHSVLKAIKSKRIRVVVKALIRK